MITVFSDELHVFINYTFLFISNDLFAQSYGFKYFYLILIILIQLDMLKYSYII